MTRWKLTDAYEMGYEYECPDCKRHIGNRFKDKDLPDECPYCGSKMTEATIEDAIKRLEWLRMVGNHVDSVTLGKEDMPCFDMAIAALREQPRWISVEERLPEDDLPGDSERLVLKVLVVIRADNGRYTIRTETRERRKYYTAKRFGKWFWGKGYKGAITHWMPLPEPPKEGE